MVDKLIKVGAGLFTALVMLLVVRSEIGLTEWEAVTKPMVILILTAASLLVALFFWGMYLDVTAHHRKNLECREEETNDKETK